MSTIARTLPVCITIAALTSSACKPKDEGPVDKPASVVPGDRFERVEFQDAVGNAPFTLRLRAVNEHGASIPHGEETILIGGEETIVDFSTQGVGTVTFEEEGTYTIEYGEQSAVVQVLDSTWPGFGMSKIQSGMPSATAVAAYGEDTLVIAEDGLWQVSFSQAPERLLSTVDAASILGVKVVDLDLDSLEDAVVWSESTVYFLRGTPQGSLAWGTGYRSQGRAVGGVEVADADQDNTLDVLVAWSATNQDSVELFTSTGLWSFETSPLLNLQGRPFSIAYGDHDGSGNDQLIVMEAGARWERFKQVGSDKEFVVLGPDIPVEIVDGTEAISVGDFNGDEAEEIFLVEPRISGESRRIYAIDLAGESIEFVTRNPFAAWLAWQDVDGDGLPEMWSMEETGALKVLTGLDGQQLEWTVGDIASPGPILARDSNGDQIPDLFVAGDNRWEQTYGALTDLQGKTVWRPAPEGLDIVLSDLRFVQGIEVDGDLTTTEWVGLQDREDGLRVKAWQQAPNNPALLELGRVGITSLPERYDDAALCGNNIYVVEQSNLHRVSLTNGRPVLETTVSGVGADHVACAIGSTGTRVVAAGGVTLTSFDGDLLQLSSETAASSVGDLTIRVVDDTFEVDICATEGCVLETWSIDGFNDITVESDGLNVVLKSTQDVELGDVGVPSLSDVDGNGELDLLLTRPDGLVTVYRSNGKGIGVPEQFATKRALGRYAFAGDDDGDGFADLFFLDDERRLFVTPAVTTLGSSDADDDTGSEERDTASAQDTGS